MFFNLKGRKITEYNSENISVKKLLRDPKDESNKTILPWNYIIFLTLGGLFIITISFNIF